jgi:hypothetical protein
VLGLDDSKETVKKKHLKRKRKKKEEGVNRARLILLSILGVWHQRRGTAVREGKSSEVDVRGTWFFVTTHTLPPL